MNLLRDYQIINEAFTIINALSIDLVHRHVL